MNKRFSSQELYSIRTDIPIRYVIESLLKIPSKEVEGIFRFVCPKCCEMQTGINSKTNLSRCFRCERNFNNIEITMEVLKLGFVESVKLLKQLLSNQQQLEGGFSKAGIS